LRSGVLVWSFDSGVSGSGIQDPGSGISVSGLGFRVSGSGFHH